MRVYVIIFPWTSLSGVKLTSTFLSVRYNMPDPAVSCLAVRLKSWGQVCKPWWCSRTSYLGLCCWGGFCACFYLLSRLPILQNLFLGVHLLVSLQNIAHMVPWQAEDFLACLNVNQSCDIHSYQYPCNLRARLWGGTEINPSQPSPDISRTKVVMVSSMCHLPAAPHLLPSCSDWLWCWQLFF